MAEFGLEAEILMRRVPPVLALGKCLRAYLILAYSIITPQGGCLIPENRTLNLHTSNILFLPPLLMNIFGLSIVAAWFLCKQCSPLS
jgi:hypothetical protein